MKQIEASELKVGDIYYYKGRYEVVLDVEQFSAYVQCIMAPTKSEYYRGIGNRYYMPRYSKVKLLVRNGMVV